MAFTTTMAGVKAADSIPKATAGRMPASSVLNRQLSRTNTKIVKSHGCYLYDEHGLEIIDASAGAAVSCIGHNQERIHQAIIEQLQKVEYCYSFYFTTPVAEELARLLVDSTDGMMSRVFVVGSGTEAVEAAMKLARQYFTELPEPQRGRTRFIAREQSYHGNTLGSLSLSGHPPRRAIYEGLLSHNVSHVSACNAYRGKTAEDTDESYVARLAQELDNEFQRLGPGTVCAFVAETVCGTTLGGAPAVPGYFKAMKEVCDSHGALIILDEVFCGMGRTGTMHAWEQEGIVPDLQTVAKGLGAGYASIGALLVNKRIVEVLKAGTAALAVQKLIREANMLENIGRQAVTLEKLLKVRLGNHPNVGDIRGRGLLWGLELVYDKDTKEPFAASEKVSARIHAMALKAPYAVCLLAASGTMEGKGGYIALAPPFNVTENEIEMMVDRTAQVVSDFFGQS